MFIKKFFSVVLPLVVLSGLASANACPKWFPMPSSDMVVVIPIYDANITGPDKGCDGLVDSVDPDIDGDGVANASDDFPLNGSEWVDTDGDGIGNNADTDDDGDGTSDTDEVTIGTNPLVPDLKHEGLLYNIVTSPKTGHKWLDRNLGASQVCTSFDDTACYGDYYQWGRNTDGHEKSGSGTTNVQADMSYVGHNEFIIWYEDWVTGYEHNYPHNRAHQWSQRDGYSVCPVGFRVPTIDELKIETIDNGVTNRNTAFSNFLKFPSPGYRLADFTGSMHMLDEGGNVWSSTVNGNKKIASIVFTGGGSSEFEFNPAIGSSMRCMKPIVTTDMPPVLTLHTAAQVEMIQFGTYPIIIAAGVDDVDGIIVPYGVATDPYGQTWGLLNTSISGVHTISYTATDSAGQVSNTVTVTVTIHPAMKKTGQTIIRDVDGVGRSHAEADNNASLRDDGYYQKGHVPLYVRDDGDEIVTDNITGLQWQDNAAVADSGNQKRWLTETNYNICTGYNGQAQDVSKCIDTSGTTATSYCDALVFGGHEDWRLPTREELVGLADYGQSNPALDPVFMHAYSHYWSSTTEAGSVRYAWSFYSNDGEQESATKSSSKSVRCVRAGQ